MLRSGDGCRLAAQKTLPPLGVLKQARATHLPDTLVAKIPGLKFWSKASGENTNLLPCGAAMQPGGGGASEIEHVTDAVGATVGRPQASEVPVFFNELQNASEFVLRV